MHDSKSELTQSRPDRLSAFLAAFPIQVQLPHDERRLSNLFVLNLPDQRMRRIVFCNAGRGHPATPGTVVAAAEVEFGGEANPLLRALPREVCVDTQDSEPLWAIAAMFEAEAAEPRCGGPAALACLGELLMLSVLRQAIDQGSTEPGILAGLAHPQLRHAVGALLEQPARAWPMEALAARSALSRSQFMLAFKQTLGMTPGSFHATWRLTLAQRRLQRGERVKTVSAACGYGSAAAFSRAYAKAFGYSPSHAASGQPSAA